MCGGLETVRFDAGYLGLEQGNPFVEFVLGIGGEIFCGELARGIALKARTIVLFHRETHSYRARLLSTRLRGNAPFNRHILGNGGAFLATELPETMTAVGFDEPGEPEVLRSEKLALPVAGDNQVLIKVSHAGVNRPDVFQRKGSYPPPPGASPIPGLEVSGQVVAIGKGVAPEMLNRRVCALVNGGGYAEYCIAHERHCLSVPANMDMAQAAAIPETLFTVWHNVFERGFAMDGETLLVHGGTSGIGTMAIQLAKAYALRVVTTAGSEEKCRAAKELGADLAVNYKTEDFVGKVNEFTNGRGADVILDMVSGDYVQRNLDCLAVEGRHVTIAALGGAKAEINMAKLMSKRQTMTGSTLRPRSDEFKALLGDEIRKNVWSLFEDGTVAPVMDQKFSLTDAAAAHARMEEGDHIGKIVLEVRAED